MRIARKYGVEARIEFFSLYKTESTNIEKKIEIIGNIRKIYEDFQISEN